MAKKQWGTLWGEIEDSHAMKSTMIPDVSRDIERSMVACCLDDIEDTKPDVNQVEPLKLDSMDPIMLYTISLHQFIVSMEDEIRLFKNTQTISYVITPEVPTPPDINYIHTPNNLNYFKTVQTPFTRGDVVTYPEISSAVAKKVLMQSVATMLAHCGYEKTHESILLLLTDLLEDFLRKLMSRLNSLQEDDKHMNASPKTFPHHIEKVLHELGLGGCKGIHDYYQSRVLKYAQVMYRRSENILNTYQKLLTHKTEVGVENDSVKYEAIEEDEGNAVEVKLDPNLEGSFTSREDELHLLNDFEAITNSGEMVDGIATYPNLNALAAIMGGDNVKVLPTPCKKKRK